MNDDRFDEYDDGESLPEEEMTPEGAGEGEIPAGHEQDPRPGEYVEPPTEELFAFEARVEEGDVPDLDPIFRAALLESPESVIPDQPDQAPEDAPPVSDHGAEVPPSGPGTGTDLSEPPHDTRPDAEEGLGPEEASAGEEPFTGEEPEQGTAEWEAEQSGVTAEQTAILEAAARSEVHEAVEYSRRTGDVWDPPRPPAHGDFQEPARRPRYWWRFLLATLIIIGSFATATQASVMNIVTDLTEGLEDPNFRKSLDDILPANTDGPQTIAILGSDVRTGGGAPEDDPGRSDTTILLRLDPDTGQIAMLSIPRDLYVEIPGHGFDKFNAAYSYGGPRLTIKTIKALTGLEINHVVNVDFQGFADVIDAVGCVYVDVDRHYFNDNSTVSFEEQYATIDIEAGYQKLCGYDALDFARYRHTDSDLVRAARQQDLIGEVRNRLSLGELVKRQKELLKAFSDNTRSDISGTDEVFQLIRLLFDSRGANVTEVSFPSTFTMRDGVSYVEATPAEIESAVNQFLGFEDDPGPVGTLNDGNGRANKAKQKEKNRKRAKAQKSAPAIPSKENDGLVDAFDSGLSEAQRLDEQIVRRDFPVFYPKRVPEGTIFETDQSRVYHTRDPDKNVFGAFRMVLSLLKDDGTHYFGLQGLRGWTDPPILEAPHDEIEMDDRKFNIFPEGDRIRLISWTDGDNVYWITNSLLLTLDNEQMLGMARSTRAFTPDK